MSGLNFWETKSLEALTPVEWEALCDGCGRCCLNKLEDKETGEVSYTSVACRLLDLHECRCTAYADRERLVSDCLTLTPKFVSEYTWLPPTCAYRRILEGTSLPWWHPLISGSSETVHDAGISLRDKAISETYVNMEDLDPYIIPEDVWRGGSGSASS